MAVALVFAVCEGLSLAFEAITEASAAAEAASVAVESASAVVEESEIALGAAYDESIAVSENIPPNGQTIVSPVTQAENALNDARAAHDAARDAWNAARIDRDAKFTEYSQAYNAHEDPGCPSGGCGAYPSPFEI